MLDLCKLFGVKKGQEFRIDNYIYRIKNNTLQYYDGWDKVFYDSRLPFNVIKDAKITIIKKYKLTQNTYNLLTLMNDNWWLAKNKNGQVFAHYIKPDKDETFWYGRGNGCTNMYFEKANFSFLDWEDEEPLQVKDILNNCEVIEEE